MFFLLIGCESSPLFIANKTQINCPIILFSKEHSKYIAFNNNNTDLDNIIFKAEINNTIFEKYCYLENDSFKGELSILFLVKSYQEIEDIINLPFYIAILNMNNKLLDLQYYSADGYLKSDLKSDLESNVELQTEIIRKISLEILNEKKPSKIILGFMLDENKLKLLN